MENREPLMPPPGQAYWLTRDGAPGELSPHINVWLYKPKLERDNETGYITWSGGYSSEAYTQWTVGFALKNCRVYPETERECIVVGVPQEEAKGD